MSGSRDLRPVRFGIIGCGRMADGFVDALRHVDGARVAAVASRRYERAREFAHRHDVARCHETADELVRDPAVDIVYVATPNHRHLPDSLLCLNNAKPVLCEKPLGLDADEVRAIIDAARRNGVFCMEAMWMRFVPAIRRLTELVERGSIGEIRSIHADFSVDVPFDPSSRLFDRAMGGGALLDLGVYPLTLVDLLLGAPDHVVATSTLAPSDVDASSVAVLEYGGGCIAVISTALNAVGPNDAVIAGTAGTIRVHGPICAPIRFDLTRRTPTSGPCSPSTAPGATWTDTGARRLRGLATSSPAAARAARAARDAIGSLPGVGTRRHRTGMLGNGYAHEVLEVARCLQEGRTESPHMSLDHSLRVASTLDAIRASAQQTERQGSPLERR